MFSVVIPLWNKRPTVAHCVASALRQHYRALELIVVDDGSTDGSREMLAGFDDPRLRIVSQPHAGPGSARNAGIRASSAPWIAFLDADDVWLADHLAELDRVRTSYPDAALIGTGFGVTRSCEDFRPPPAAPRRIGPVDFLGGAAARRPAFCTSSSAIRRETFLELGGFGPAPGGEDYEYFARIALRRPIVASSAVTAVYRLESGGISDMADKAGPNPISCARDLGPSVAHLVDRYREIECPQLRRNVDRYIESQYRSWVRKCARAGNIEALRRRPRIGLAGAGLAEGLILAAATLPPGIARPLYATGYAGLAWLRRAASAVRDSAARRSSWRNRRITSRSTERTRMA